MVVFTILHREVNIKAFNRVGTVSSQPEFLLRPLAEGMQFDVMERRITRIPVRSVCLR